MAKNEKKSNKKTVYVEIVEGQAPTAEIKGLFGNAELAAIDKAIRMQNRVNKIEIQKANTKQEKDDE